MSVELKGCRRTVASYLHCYGVTAKKIAIIKLHAEVPTLGNLDRNGGELAYTSLVVSSGAGTGQGDVVAPTVGGSEGLCGSKALGLLEELGTEDLVDHGEG